jgi:hypothetical protein
VISDRVFRVDGSTNTCGVCRGTLEFFSKGDVLEYTAEYWQCSSCSSVQVLKPFWAEEAHSRAISILDTGLVNRSIVASRFIGVLIFLEKKLNSRVLDWGGGVGLLARLLRDQGINTFSFDKYAEGFLIEGFTIQEKNVLEEFEFLLSVECFEHLISPIKTFGEITTDKDYFVFTTELISTPPPDPSKRSWWYYMPESGQHITFASAKGIRSFAIELGFHNYIQVGNLHILSKRRLRFLTRVVLKNRIFRKIAMLIVPEILCRRRSLIWRDSLKLQGK